jgi:hypothetical protein
MKTYRPRLTVSFLSNHYLQYRRKMDVELEGLYRLPPNHRLIATPDNILDYHPGSVVVIRKTEVYPIILRKPGNVRTGNILAPETKLLVNLQVQVRIADFDYSSLHAYLLPRLFRCCRRYWLICHD